MSTDRESLRQFHRAMWATGDFAKVALDTVDSARELVARADIGPGMEVLDVATGSGNVAIPAAEAGAIVIGLDLVPELLEAGRQRSAEAAVEVEWIEGDAEELPFADGRFDRVVSAFGVMFAPQHERAAGELDRVLKPGGKLAMSNWTQQGVGGQIYEATSKYLPPAPDARSPFQWGSEEHVRQLFAGKGYAFGFERKAVTFRSASAAAYMGHMTENFGPMCITKQVLETTGRWDDLRSDVVTLLQAAGRSTESNFEFEQEYLQAIGSKPGA